MIELKLLGILKQYAPSSDGDGCFAVEYKPGMTVADALSRTGISEATVKYTIMVNNMRKKTDHILEDSDVIMVMALVSGG